MRRNGELNEEKRDVVNDLVNVHAYVMYCEA